MKKKLIMLILAIALISTTLSGCGNAVAEVQDQTAETEQPAKEKGTSEDEAVEEPEDATAEEPKTVQEEQYINLKTVQYNADGSVETLTKSIFNESGNIVKGIVYNGDGSIETLTEYEYDENDQCTKCITHDADGNAIESNESKYDSNGNCIEWIKYDGDGNVTDSSLSEYDDNGNEIKETWLMTFDIGEDEPYVSTSVFEYEYDDNNNQVKSTAYDEDGSTVDIIWEYTYDSVGNQITETQYNADGSILSIEKCEYNSENKIIKESNCYEDGTEYRMAEYEYDSNGNKTKDMINYYSTGLSSLYEYEYDADNRQIKSTSYKDGAIESVRHTEYDDYGNIIKRTEYGADGAMVLLVENEYIKLQDYLSSKESIDQEEIEIVNKKPVEKISIETETTDDKSKKTEETEAITGRKALTPKEIIFAYDGDVNLEKIYYRTSESDSWKLFFDGILEPGSLAYNSSGKITIYEGYFAVKLVFDNGKTEHIHTTNLVEGEIRNYDGSIGKTEYTGEMIEFIITSSSENFLDVDWE